MRLIEWFRGRKRREKELEDEIESHFSMAIRDRMERGEDKTAAEANARGEFGNELLIREVTREVWGWVWLETLAQDVRYGLRMLRNHPGFTAAVTITIALGVGINVGIFSVLNAASLRLLPVPGADRLVGVSQAFRGRFRREVQGEGSMFSYPQYLEYRDHNHVFSGLVAYEPFVEVTLGRNLQHLLGAAASCNYFDVLSEHPPLGRGFMESDCAAPGANAVVVISDAMWRGTFAGNSSILGKRISLKQTAYTVIGVAPPGFAGTEPIASDFWIPVTMDKALEPGLDRLADDNMSWLAMLGRVQPAMKMGQVRADLTVIAARLDQLHPGRTTSLAVQTARFLSRPEERRQAVIPVASVALAACGLVLLLACANVANLLLARVSMRQKEIALRLSLGASRARLVRQWLTESLLLSLLGGTLGSALALWFVAGLTRYVTSLLSRALRDVPAVVLNLAPDFRVLAYAFGLTVTSGIAFGLIPAFESTRAGLNTALKEDGGSGRGSGSMLRSASVSVQIAVCMILLLATGLLLRAVYYSQSVDPGFDTKNVASVFLNLRAQGYDARKSTALMERLRERIAGLPGVAGVAQAECAPLSHDFSADHFTVSGLPDKVGIEYNHVSPDYFSVLGIPILRGRNFTPAEARAQAPVIIVTESTARLLWPKQDPLAKTLRESTGREDTVIGVAKDAQISHLGESDSTYLFFPAGPEDDLRAYLLVRFAGDFPATAKGIHSAVQSLDPEMPADVSRLEDYLEGWRMPSRLVTALAGALGALALILASIGVYGLASYSVSRRTHEIGIRMALGAEGADVITLVLRQSMRPVLIGGLIGVAGCAAASSVLSSLLLGISAHDPAAFISVPMFLLVVALTASYIPARRAIRVDPVVALRHE